MVLREVIPDRGSERTSEDICEPKGKNRIRGLMLVFLCEFGSDDIMGSSNDRDESTKQKG